MWAGNWGPSIFAETLNLEHPFAENGHCPSFAVAGGRPYSPPSLAKFGAGERNRTATISLEG